MLIPSSFKLQTPKTPKSKKSGKKHRINESIFCGFPILSLSLSFQVNKTSSKLLNLALENLKSVFRKSSREYPLLVDIKVRML